MELGLPWWFSGKKKKKKKKNHLPMQKTWVRSNLQKDPTSHGTSACAVHQEKPLQWGA